MDDTVEIAAIEGNSDLTLLTGRLLAEARAVISKDGAALCVPIAELSTLGAGVSSLTPAFHTVTQTTTVAADGLYRLANAGVGDVLKAAKNGNFWGAFKTADGSSKFAQLQSAGPLSATTKTATALNPATVLMAVALFSIEKDLGKIADMEKQILSFLEIEKQSEIEADIETLMGIAAKYKSNWDNAHFTASNHKLVLDIQRSARKNMLAYQKKVADALKARQLFTVQSQVNAAFSDLQRDFQYYRLSLYTFSLASLMEALLSGNFKEEYLSGIKGEIKTMSESYRALFDRCSTHLEQMGSVAVEAAVLTGLGAAGREVGKLIGSIPHAKGTPVKNFLQNSGDFLTQNAEDMKTKAVKEFAPIGNPNTGIFIEKLDDMIRIYSRTSQICFDSANIYLLP